MKKLYFLLLAVAVSLGFNAAAKTVHFTASEFEQISADNHREFTVELDGVSITISDGCNTFGAFRIYKGNTMTVSASSAIKTIWVCSSADYSEKYGAGNFTVEVGTYAQNTDTGYENWGVWTPGDQKVTTVVLTSSTAQVRANDIEVEVEDQVSILNCNLNLGMYSASGDVTLYSLGLNESSTNVFTGELYPQRLVSAISPYLSTLDLNTLYANVETATSPMAGTIEAQTWGSTSTESNPSITVGINLMTIDGKNWGISALISQFIGGGMDLNTPVLVTADFNRNMLILGNEPIKGDLNGDGSVDGSDVSILLEMVLAGGLTDAQIDVADLNDDGSVDGSDVSILLEIVLAGE